MAWSDAARKAAAEARRRKATGRVKVGKGLYVSRGSLAHHLRTERKMVRAVDRGVMSRAQINKTVREQARAHAKGAAMFEKRSMKDWGTLPGGQKVR